MKPHHFLTLVIVFLIGYAVARYFPGLGHKVGMP